MIGEVVRGRLGYDGLLFSDDLSMNALSGTVGQRAAAALAAGCDIGLHSNGVMDEMLDVAANVRPLTPDAARRAEAALRQGRHAPEPLDVEAAHARLDAALAAA